jgi:P-type Ca2+ transporter type 2C
VLTQAQWLRIVFLGVLMAIATLVVKDYFESLVGDVVAMTMSMTVFALCLVSMGLSARNETGSMLSRDVVLGRRQLSLYGVSLLLIVLASSLGVLQRVLGTAPLTGAQWLVCLVIAVGLLLVDEAIKVFLRTRGRQEVVDKPSPVVVPARSRWEHNAVSAHAQAPTRRILCARMARVNDAPPVRPSSS